MITSRRQRVDTQGAVSNELGADNLLLVLINGAESWSIFKVASILLFVQDHWKGTTCDVNWTQPRVFPLDMTSESILSVLSVLPGLPLLQARPPMREAPSSSTRERQEQ